MSNLVEHAVNELKIAGLFDEDSDYGGLLAKSIVDLIEKLSDQDHSGASASMAIGIFSKLARYEPLTPLTGDDSEWNDVGNGQFQNKRCSHVFKGGGRFDGKAYDLNAKIFRQPDGCTYTSSESLAEITFPYTPKTEIIDVPFVREE